MTSIATYLAECVFEFPSLYGLWVLTCGAVLGWLAYLVLPTPRRRLPPGPKRWPVLGNYPQLAKTGGDKVHHFYAFLYKTFGQVSLTYFGKYPLVVVSGYNAIQEAFVQQGGSTLSRPDIPGFRDTKHFGTGVAFTNGPAWSARRGVLLAGLSATMKGAFYEHVVLTQAQDLIDTFSSIAGAFQPRKYLLKAVVSCNCSALLGRSYKHGDPVFEIMYDACLAIVSSSGALSPCSTIPGLKHIPGINKSYNTYKTGHQTLHTAIGAELKDRKCSYKDGQIECVIDAFIQRQKRNPEGSTCSGEYECYRYSSSSECSNTEYE